MQTKINNATFANAKTYQWYLTWNTKNKIFRKLIILLTFIHPSKLRQSISACRLCFCHFVRFSFTLIISWYKFLSSSMHRDCQTYNVLSHYVYQLVTHICLPSRLEQITACKLTTIYNYTICDCALPGNNNNQRTLIAELPTCLKNVSNVLESFAFSCEN